MPQAILFDLDGVLVDTYEVWFFLLNDVAQRHGYPPVTREVYRTSWGQGIEVDAKLFYPRHTVPEIREEYSRYYGDHLHHLRVMAGAVETLSSIRLPKAVITNSPTDLATRALSLAKLGSHFRTVVGCDQVAASKPAPDVVFEACRRLGVEPRDALVVGDSRFDEGAAQAAGAGFVWFRSFAELRI
ncbi:MAG TPA: HAD family hydrolase [Planctomycetota bacterium]|jgi:HAD superfamily hydrolase (TIGR01509 family)|nr:HAD family hydrolase [Planctomycetota bacterium]